MSAGKGKSNSGNGFANVKELFNEGSTEYLVSILKMMNSVSYVQPDEVPNIDLYMDQVTTFMDEHLESSKRYSDDKLLTKTMINNYTKNSLLPSPDKKKYSQDHMYTMLFIYYLKNILSISDTRSILGPLTDMFFKESGSVNLKEIYTEIFEIEKEQATSIARDVVKKYYKSRKSFAGVEKEKEKEYLQAFAFISMLCFDVYMKKQMIGKIIDDGFIISFDSDLKKKKSAEAKKPTTTKKTKSEAKAADNTKNKTK